MTTIQIVGIAVASAIVILLVIALLVTRRRGGEEAEAPPADETPSFLDAPVNDTLGGLGAAEHVPEETTGDLGPGLDWGPSGADVAGGAAAAAAGKAAAEKEATTHEGEGEVAGQPAAAPEELLDKEGGTPAGPGPARPAEGGSAVKPPAASESGPAGRRVPLSDIIVTTSNKIVDLDDPEVRRMLTDLVTFEIDQAKQYRQLGQTIDAVLQLTEAEKIARALGLDETAGDIRGMMDDLNH